MKRTLKQIFTTAVVVPLFLIVTLTPAQAVFGSILAGIQRYHDDRQSDHSNFQRYWLPRSLLTAS